MKNIKYTVYTLLCASLIVGLCSCTTKTEETKKERETTTTTTEETTSEGTTTEESETDATTSEAAASEATTVQQSGDANEDEAYEAFIEGLAEAMRNEEPYYYGPDHTDADTGELGIATYYLSWSDSFYYTLTDIDGDGRHELLIGHEDYGQSGDPIIRVDGFVVMDNTGRCNVLIISWERSMTEYIGNGYFLTGGSSGAMSGVSEIAHFDGSSVIIDATLLSESEETDDGYVTRYTLYLGGEEEGSDPVCGDEAYNSWNEIYEEAQSYDNELVGAEWNEVMI